MIREVRAPRAGVVPLTGGTEEDRPRPRQPVQGPHPPGAGGGDRLREVGGPFNICSVHLRWSISIGVPLHLHTDGDMSVPLAPVSKIVFIVI